MAKIANTDGRIDLDYLILKRAQELIAGGSSILSVTQTKSSITSKVFSVPELFTHILLELPMRDLLLAQRVCREWKDAITNSAVLQRALFFLPDIDNEKEGMEPRFNPLLAEAFPGWLKAAAVRPELGARCQTPIPTHSFFKPGAPDSSNKTSILMGAEASWRDMLPVQPAVKKMWLLVYCETVPTLQARLSFNNGLRMGQLFNIFSK